MRAWENTDTYSNERTLLSHRYRLGYLSIRPPPPPPGSDQIEKHKTRKITFFSPPYGDLVFSGQCVCVCEILQSQLKKSIFREDRFTRWSLLWVLTFLRWIQLISWTPKTFFFFCHLKSPRLYIVGRVEIREALFFANTNQNEHCEVLSEFKYTRTNIYIYIYIVFITIISIFLRSRTSFWLIPSITGKVTTVENQLNVYQIF